MSHVANSSIPPPWMGYRSIAALPSPPPSSIFIHLAPDVQKVDLTLSTGQITIHWIMQLIPVILIHWIVIYPVDSTIQHLNNPGQVEERQSGARFLVQVSKGWVRGQLKFQTTLLVGGKYGYWNEEDKQRQYCLNLLVYLVNLLDK